MHLNKCPGWAHPVPEHPGEELLHVIQSDAFFFHRYVSPCLHQLTLVSCCDGETGDVHSNAPPGRATLQRQL